MSDTIKGEGHCLCGAVSVTASTMGNKVGACHCGMCRRWTGGPLMAIDCSTNVTFEGEENITVFESSQWAERGFCNKCGSHLFYRLKENKQYFIPAGLFETCDNLVLNSQVFIDKKPAYYSFSNETKNMTEAEIFAMYA